MQTFTIDNENNITALEAGQEPPPEEGTLTFSSAADLHNLLSDWPMSRLLEIWNSIPGFTPVKKFMDRKTAVSRIYRAAQSLVPGATAGLYEPAAEPAGKTGGSADEAAQTASRRETFKRLAKSDRAKRKAAVAAKKTGGDAKAKDERKVANGRAGAAIRYGKQTAIVSGDTTITGKRADVLKLISRPQGATLAELMKETGWMAHSIRGMISTLGSKDGVKIESTKPEGGERTYKVTAPATRKAKAGK